MREQAPLRRRCSRGWGEGFRRTRGADARPTPDSLRTPSARIPAVTKVAAERLSRGRSRYAANAPTGFDVDLSDPRARAAAAAASGKGRKAKAEGKGKGKGGEAQPAAGAEASRGGADALAWARRPKSKKAHHAFKSKRRFKRR